MKGSAVKAIWICALLSLLAIIVYGRYSIVPSDAGEPRAATPAPELMHNDGPAATNLAVYVLLHETRDAGDLLQAAARTNACLE